MIYISTACLKGKYIGEILARFAENGIINIELSGGTEYYGTLFDDLKKFQDTYGVRYACHAYFPPPKEHFVVNLASCNDEIYTKSIEHYQNCIQMIRQLDCNTLSVHAGFYVEISPTQIGGELNDGIIYDHNAAIDRMCSAYKKLEKECRQYNIIMYLENNVLNPDNFKRFHQVNQLMMTDYDAYQELASQMDFNLLLDIGHLHVSCGTMKKDFQYECRCFAEKACWLHISENNGQYDQHQPLLRNSEIVKAYGEYFDKRLPITLETNGSLEEILESYRIVKGIQR